MEHVMRAKEFTINIPINIKMNSDGSVDVDTDNDEDARDPEELDQEPIFVPPLQQEIELNKHSQGKDSKVIDKLTTDEEYDDEDEY